MPGYTIRPFRSLADADRQYRLWLAATEGLTRPWRSCLRNVEHQLGQAERFPGCRLYAERPDGSLAGYIGTHPPFEWSPAAHGPPSDRLGWAIPFGLPWTHPRDPALEVTLYDEMIRTTPETFAGFQRDIYIQRFRESWTDRIGFLTDRGWRLLKRLPLLGRAVGAARLPGPDLSPVTEVDLGLLAALSERDPTTTPVTIDALRGRCDGGWLDLDSTRRLGDRGAFSLEARGRWAAVTAFFAGTDDWDEVLAAAAAHAAQLGVGEIYFTIDEHEHQLHRALTDRGFGEVDAGVYYTRDAD